MLQYQNNNGLLSTNGWTRLPNGLLMQWGFATATSTDGTNFTSSTNFTISFSTVFTVFCMTSNAESAVDTRLIGQIRLTSATNTTFTTASRNNVNALGASSYTFQYLALGV